MSVFECVFIHAICVCECPHYRKSERVSAKERGRERERVWQRKPKEDNVQEGQAEQGAVGEIHE